MTNATQSPARGVEVTRADREAAEKFFPKFDSYSRHTALAEAFARHRFAHSTPLAQPEDGSEEVERLREALHQVDAAICDKSYFAALQTARVALAIKGGGGPATSAQLIALSEQPDIAASVNDKGGGRGA